MAYTRLNPEQIRILRLQSRSFSVDTPSPKLGTDAPIHCELYTVNRKDNADYDALSYVWGDDKDTLPVLVKHTDGPVDGVQVDYEEVQVTRNLAVALEHFRDDTVNVNLWVDALCINQEDDVEKGVQVENMKDVYASATRTRVWLGPAQGNSDQAMFKFSDIGAVIFQRGVFDAMMRMDRHSSELQDEAYNAEVVLRERMGDKLREAAVHHAEYYHLLKELVYLLSKPYWKRAWILQEIVVSRGVDVFCGKSKIDVALLHAAVQYMIYMQIYVCRDLYEKLMAALDRDAANPGVVDLEFDPDLMPKFNEMQEVGFAIPKAATHVFGMRQEYQSHVEESDQTNEFDLMRLLSQIRVGREATNNKDKIYALLGMAGDSGKLGIAVNYDKSYSCSRLYSDTARAIISLGHVDLLSFAQQNGGKDGISSQPGTVEEEVPFWVPDWRNEIMEPYGLLPWHTPYYAAGKEEQGKFEKHPEFDSAPFEHLILSGYRVDLIDSLGDQCNEGKYLSMGDRKAAWKYLKDIQTLCEESDKKHSQTGREIYSNNSVREFARSIIPVAGIVGRGFFRAASVGECISGREQVIKDCQGWPGETPPREKPIEMQLYYTAMARQVVRRPFITTKGFVGLAPSHAQERDVVVIFRGARFPYTLRKNGNGKYKLIGETYLHGVMYGEFIKPDVEEEEFCLE